MSPGEVQNLRSTLDTSTLSLTLDWDKPLNCETAKDVTAYDIWFKTCASLEREGYCKTTVKASASHIHLTRESGLKPLMKHEFKIRAQNADHDGDWSRIEKYIGKYTHACFIRNLSLNLLATCNKFWLDDVKRHLNMQSCAKF